MNASAILTSQGWLGPGHALDSRLTDYGAQKYTQKGHRGLAYDPKAGSAEISSGNGLVKPLLISQRGLSRHGIGKKSHEPASGNQWWLKGFQSALQNIGKTEEERPKQTGYTGKHMGLYGYFVSGQIMQGTIETKKRKSDAIENTKEHERPVKKAQLEDSLEYLAQRDRDRRTAHKKSKSCDVQDFEAVGEFMNVRDKKKKKRRDEQASGDLLAQMVEEELARLSSMNNSETEDTTQKRKSARKKKRKDV